MGRPSKNYTEREKKQSRCFTAIVYEKSESYNYQIILNKVMDDGSGWDEWYYIKHDKDEYTDNDVYCWLVDNNIDTEDKEKCPFKSGDLKKPHYHIVVYREAPIVLGLASIKIGIPSNFVQEVGDKKKMIQYLIHARDPEKTRYGIEEIITNNSSGLSKYFKGLDEMSVGDKARIIIEFLEQNYNTNLVFICERLIDLGVFDEFRRGQHLYMSVCNELRERNRQYAKMENTNNVS